MMFTVMIMIMTMNMILIMIALSVIMFFRVLGARSPGPWAT